MTDFRTELESLVNRYAREAGSGTPDFILADHLIGSLELFDRTTNMRDQWWGFDPKIGGVIPAKRPDLEPSDWPPGDSVPQAAPLDP